MPKISIDPPLDSALLAKLRATAKEHAKVTQLSVAAFDGMSTPSIIDLLGKASKRVAIEVPKVNPADTSRFNVACDRETREFLDAQALALGSSLAGLCGTILQEVVAETKRRAKSGQS